jgi:hypothetical protein
MAIKQKYVSEADIFLAQLNANHPLSESQKAEIARSYKVFQKRDQKSTVVDDPL